MKKFFQDESGATMVEYGLMVALIACVVIAAVTAIGGSLNSIFLKISGILATAAA
jgi:pilus assembly protein Flp/PilA